MWIWSCNFRGKFSVWEQPTDWPTPTPGDSDSAPLLKTLPRIINSFVQSLISILSQFTGKGRSWPSHFSKNPRCDGKLEASYLETLFLVEEARHARLVARLAWKSFSWPTAGRAAPWSWAQASANRWRSRARLLCKARRTEAASGTPWIALARVTREQQH